jgi:putative ABC transport system ATP-binding protein
MTIVDIQDLTKSYLMGEVLVHALQSVSFQVESGEYVAITGRSGSGKSTLLNLLGCLDQPTSGHYVLAGQDVSHLTDDELSDIRRHRIGFMFQSFNLIPRLTVLENIELPLVYAGITTQEREARALELAEAVGLAGRVDHRPTELSGGELQRVAIARALANKPVMILADEPTGNLDTRTGTAILALLASLWQQGTTIILVTHDIQIARNAPRVLQLQDGMLINYARSERAAVGQALS